MPLPLVPVAVVAAGAGGLGLLALAKAKHPAPDSIAGTGATPPVAASGTGKPLSGLPSEVKAAFEVANVQKQLASTVVKLTGGNQAQQDVAGVSAWVNPAGFAVTAGLATRNVVDNALKGIGIGDAAVRNQAGQVAGLAVGLGCVAGAPAVLGGLAVKGIAEGASALEGAIFGKKAEQDTRNFIKQFDPTASGTPAAAFVGGISNAINSLFGGGPPKPTPAQIAAATALGTQVISSDRAIAQAYLARPAAEQTLLGRTASQMILNGTPRMTLPFPWPPP